MQSIITFGGYESNGREANLTYQKFTPRYSPEGTGWISSSETGIGYVVQEDL
jgi:hypothetical protein